SHRTEGAMTALSNESRALFRTARSALSPSTGDRERVRARLAAKIGVAAAGGASVPAAKAGTLALVAKIAAPIVIAGAAATVAVPRVNEYRAARAAPA